jgi:hypothetical protein
MTDPRRMERAAHAFNALSHSAQADGVIERSTAVWAVEEGRALLSELDTLRAELVAALRPFAKCAETFTNGAEDETPLAVARHSSMNPDFTVGDMRRARELVRALSPPIGGGG